MINIINEKCDGNKGSLIATDIINNKQNNALR